MKGTLYIVPTPIGNMEDITLRAIRILKEVDLVLAEDTRTSSVLLKHLGISSRLASHHKFNEHETAVSIASRISEGLNVALVSDAGTPGISDPGFMLSRECSSLGVEVITLPGPTACIPAIVSSGLPCDRFCFEGFLPQKKGRHTLLEQLKEETRTMIFYESPRRLSDTLDEFCDVFGADRQCSVAREISKIHETHHRGTLEEVSSHFKSSEAKGEIVIVVSGKVQEKKEHHNKFRNEEEENRGEQSGRGDYGRSDARISDGDIRS